MEKQLNQAQKKASQSIAAQIVTLIQETASKAKNRHPVRKHPDLQAKVIKRVTQTALIAKIVLNARATALTCKIPIAWAPRTWSQPWKKTAATQQTAMILHAQKASKLLQAQHHSHSKVQRVFYQLKVLTQQRVILKSPKTNKIVQGATKEVNAHIVMKKTPMSRQGHMACSLFPTLTHLNGMTGTTQIGGEAFWQSQGCAAPPITDLISTKYESQEFTC